MRIALVCPYDWSRHGGVQAHIRQLAAHLASHHEVLVVSPGLPRGADADGPVGMVRLGRAVALPYNRSRAPISLWPAAVRGELAALRAFEPDVVHVHEPLAPLAGLAATLRAPRPVIGTFHAWSTTGRLYRTVAPAARRVLGRTAGLLAVSEAAQAYAAARLGLRPEHLRVVPNGVDLEAFAGAVPYPDLADPERPLLLFVGRLEARKGLAVLVRAFLQLRATHPGLRLLVVGDGPERERCAGLLPASVAGDVRFVGAVSDAEKARYAASADLFVAPNLGGESFGIVLVEAMAAGLPVVASDLPGFRGVVGERGVGRLVPVGDPGVLAEAVAALLDDHSQRAAMAAAARERAARYDWKVVAAELEEIYAAVA